MAKKNTKKKLSVKKEWEEWASQFVDVPTPNDYVQEIKKSLKNGDNVASIIEGAGQAIFEYGCFYPLFEKEFRKISDALNKAQKIAKKHNL